MLKLNHPHKPLAPPGAHTRHEGHPKCDTCGYDRILLDEMRREYARLNRQLDALRYCNAQLNHYQRLSEQEAARMRQFSHRHTVGFSAIAIVTLIAHLALSLGAS